MPSNKVASFSWAIVLLLVTLLTPSVAQQQDPQEGPSAIFNRNEAVGSFWQYFDDFPDSVQSFFAYIANFDVLWPNARLLFDSSKLRSAKNCAVCIAGITQANELVQNGTQYADIRDSVIEYCIAAVNASFPDQESEIICPGLMDNYVPEIFNILSIKPASNAEEPCILFNICEPSSSSSSGELGEAYQSVKSRAKTDAKTTQARSKTGARTKRKEKTRATVNRANSIRVAHITDVHVEERYMEGSATDFCGFPVCCRPEFEGPGSAGYWGSYRCNAPPRTTELVIEFVASLDPSPDFVIYTGDNPPHSIWEQTLEGQTAVSRWTAQTMRKYFPSDILVYPTLGNHDNFPSDLFYSYRNATQLLTKAFFSDWQPLANWTAEHQQTIELAGYYSLLIRPGLRLFSVNSNYGDVKNYYNWVNIDQPELAEMFSAIDDVLNAARAAGEKVILEAHHPIGSPRAIIQWSRAIRDLIIRHHDVIVLVPEGHSHLDEVQIIIDSADGVAKEVQYIAGTANPKNNANPSARVYYLDPATFELLDYDHYYFDIEAELKSPSADNATMQLSYTASVEYNLPDLSPASWLDLTYRMEESTELFDRYWNNRQTRSGQSGVCDAACRQRELCKIRTTAYDEYLSCVSAT